MVIDLLKEKLITLNEAARFFPRPTGSRPIHLATLYAYSSKGKSGVILESVQAGDVRCTSVEAIGRFFAALTQRKNLKPVGSNAGVQEAIAANERLKAFVFRRRKRQGASDAG